MNKITINDQFWTYYINLVKEVVVPYQWDALNDNIPEAEPSHAIKNFKIAAGLEDGQFYGMVFQDSDVAKWLEAVGYLLAIEHDPELERIADSVIDIIAKAQQPDGYLNTYYILKEPDNRWSNLCECHELYCAGHLIEGAISYYNATGKRKILDVVIKLTDHIAQTFGDEVGKLHGYDGHQELELALMKLYEITKDEQHLNLSRYFIEVRGVEQDPHFYDLEYEKRNKSVHFGQMMIENKAYSQAHQSIHNQEKAVGHAVRFVYMCTGMAHLAAVTDDKQLYESCKRLWDNMVGKQMYITGAIGSQCHGEAFTFDYDLPNDIAYTETCASIGMMFFARRMLENEPQSHYADVMEKALYNTVLAGMARDGKSFFYVNPLEVHPETCEKNENYKHVKPVRQSWFGCACCPPNVARLIASLDQYLYTTSERTVYANLYVSGQADFTLTGDSFSLEQNSNYPWDGMIDFTIQTADTVDFTLALRIPNWCNEAMVKINDAVYLIDSLIENGYAMIKRSWKNGDHIQLILSLPVLVMKSHPLIRQNAGKVALQRGPIVYCLEEADNGKNLHQIELLLDKDFEVTQDSSFIENLHVINGVARKQKTAEWGDGLYRQNEQTTSETVPVKLIPYFAWANRGTCEMQVWTRFVD